MEKWYYDIDDGQINFNWQLFIGLAIFYFFLELMLNSEEFNQLKLRLIVVRLKYIVLFLLVNSISYQFNLTNKESSVQNILSKNNKEILHVHNRFDELEIKNVYIYDGSLEFFSFDNICFTVMILFGIWTLKVIKEK